LDNGLAVLDDAGCLVEINQSLLLWLGHTEAQLRGRPFWPAVWKLHPDWEDPVRSWLQGPGAFGRLELSAVLGGSCRWFRIETARHRAICFLRLHSILPPLAEAQQPAWGEHLRSDAAQRQAWVRLQRAEAHLNHLMERWPGVIFSQRADFTFDFVSSKIEELTGVAPEEWKREPARFWQIVHEADVGELRRQLERLERATHSVTSTYRIRHCRTGRVACILEQREAVRGENGLLAYEGFWIDLTRQTISETRLDDAMWKEALAALTMGFAHEFNNLSAGIISLCEGFEAQIEKDHPFQEGLALIRRTSLEASQLLHRIVQLHRGEIGERNYHNLNDLTTDMVELIRRLIPRRIQIETGLANEPLPIYVDPVQFRQVFVHLTLNAVDAMPEAGRLRFETSRHDQPPPLEQGQLSRGPVVSLSVQDTGSGIATRHLAKVFDRFFTTKALNKGSGLGLCNARLFAEKHHGSISVDSVEHQGTRLRIWLPQADFTEAEQERTRRATRRHTLLLLGPAGNTLDNTAQFLREHGLYVVVTSEEDAALDLACSAEYDFSALMVQVRATDSPQVSLIGQIRPRKLPLKTILQIIGGNQDELRSRFLDQADLIISTDLPEAELLARLNSVLDAAS